ncbi:ferredoxin reductase [Flavobacterium limnosediminis JC2902]|uniref:Ferredoxin reductase n=1 Tax=Flavobacterium limnosediminis JC2902 TaxID=1341181 RepID=V6SMH7_9FLAO|nr:FAD-binding oxidoreductase [Flavobacterium limnosediminis]ESU25615.1 ferredoxin reductase [Flavobacterium limnosediminis JC2902]
MKKGHVVKVLKARFITHDVKSFVVEKPLGYDFSPGQATEVAINSPQWKNETRPFTFTNLKESNYLEFMIKIYKERKGVTNELGRINAGDELILHDVFGTINYKGPGVFIAAGSGITPFISIFRELYKNNQIHGNRLIYVNKTSEDVIMGNELHKMLKNNFINVYTRENVVGFLGRRIDRNFLIENIVDFNQNFYVCGPADFVKTVTQNLLDLGAIADAIVIEN